MALLKRPNMLHYGNTGTEASPVWSLINEGVTTFDSTLEPQTEELHCVAELNAREYTNSINASYSFTAAVNRKDAINQKLYDICANQTIDAEMEVVHVLYDTSDGEPDKTALPARKMNYSISPSKEPSGDPGSFLTVEGTLNQLGTITTGTFNMTTKEFTAASDD